jgi:hypothetical protein
MICRLMDGTRMYASASRQGERDVCTYDNVTATHSIKNVYACMREDVYACMEGKHINI